MRRGYLPLEALALNEAGLISRSALTRMLTDPRRDIDHECGYPVEISNELYDSYYRRGLGARVVNIFPEEGWKKTPEVYETDDAKDTPFEKAWKASVKKHNLYEVMQRADVLSGISRFGVILLGFNDGGKLDDPVKSFSEKVEASQAASTKLLYVRAFPEKAVTIASWEADTTNPRFGLPTSYTIQFIDPASGQNTAPANQATSLSSRTVHWHRIIHLADNRRQSDIYGTPRMEDVFDRLYDLKKILGGGSEMFWKGGFPGLSFELAQNVDPNVEIDKEGLKEQFEKYSNGLQRYMALTGMTAKSLSPQVADPNNHLEANIKAICITKGIPYRIFMGTEEAQLAGEQDNDAWLSRIASRRELYQTPHIVRNLVNRLIQVKALPAPQEMDEETEMPKYEVHWPDLRIKGEKEKADVAKVRIDTVAAWSGGQLDTLIPPTVFFTQFLGMAKEEAEAIVKAATEYLKGVGEDADLKKNLDEMAAEEQKAALEAQQAMAGDKGTPPGEKGATEQVPAQGDGEEEPDTDEEEPATHGGPGSGNFGHGGRPGERGGSSSGGGGSAEEKDPMEGTAFSKKARAVKEAASVAHASGLSAKTSEDHSKAAELWDKASTAAEANGEKFNATQYKGEAGAHREKSAVLKAGEVYSRSRKLGATYKQAAKDAESAYKKAGGTKSEVPDFSK